MKLTEIKQYPTKLEIFTNGKEKDFTVDFDGAIGEYTREEWKEDLEEKGLNNEDVEEILNTLESVSNVDFFSKA